VVVRGSVPRTGGDRIWRLAGEVSLPDGPRAYDQELVRTGDSTFELRTEHSALGVDAAAGVLIVDAPTESLVSQLVATYGLPLLLEDAPAVVLHACAAVPPDRDSAVVVCARSGTGKSTLIRGFLEAGWRAVTEDVCAIDLRSTRPVVWPGPPWLRRAGEGPRGSSHLYDLPDKSVWDISSSLTDLPMPVGHLVFLEPAGGHAVEWHPISGGSAMADLAAATIRLSNPTRRAELMFGATARVARSAPSARLRLPVSADWFAVAEATIRHHTEGR
jgi:hypothetical protein